MAWCVDQVQNIGFTVICDVINPHGVCLDRDASFAFDVHAVQQLFLHIALGHCICGLDQPIGQGGFPVIDVGNNRKVTDFAKLCHSAAYDLNL